MCSISYWVLKHPDAARDTTSSFETESRLSSYIAAQSERRRRPVTCDSFVVRSHVKWLTHKSSVAIALENACLFHALSWHRPTPVCRSLCIGDSFLSVCATAWQWTKRSHRISTTSVSICQDLSSVTDSSTSVCLVPDVLTASRYTRRPTLKRRRMTARSIQETSCRPTPKSFNSS